MSEIKKRGRPPLSDADRELRRIERNKKSNEAHKRSGYAARKKYEKNNPEKVRKIKIKSSEKYSDIHIYIPKEYKPILDEIIFDAKLSITDFFLSAIEEKYNIKLTKKNKSSCPQGGNSTK